MQLCGLCVPIGSPIHGYQNDTDANNFQGDADEKVRGVWGSLPARACQRGGEGSFGGVGFVRARCVLPVLCGSRSFGVVFLLPDPVMRSMWVSAVGLMIDGV